MTQGTSPVVMNIKMARSIYEEASMGKVTMHDVPEIPMKILKVVLPDQRDVRMKKYGRHPKDYPREGEGSLKEEVPEFEGYETEESGTQ